MQPDIEGNVPVSATPLDRCLVDGDAAAILSGRRQRRKALGISFAIETAALALLLIVPLMTSIAQPIFSTPDFVPFVFGTKHIHDKGQLNRTPISRPGKRYDNVVTFNGGHVTPRPPTQEVEEVEGSIIAGEEGWGQAQDGLQTLGIDGMRPTDPVPPIEIKKSEEKSRLKISGSVEQAQLILRIEPRYPPLAIQVKIEGTVILHAIISRDGRITALDVVSGPPLLLSAALEAVRQWRYRPTLLNGEPVEVETTITVIFRLQA